MHNTCTESKLFKYKDTSEDENPKTKFHMHALCGSSLLTCKHVLFYYYTHHPLKAIQISASIVV